MFLEDAMRGRFLVALVTGLILAVAPASADDKTGCLKGIAKLKAVKNPTAAQKKKLSDAEQEQMEADWSECMDVLRK
jgi:hypothetical protein